MASRIPVLPPPTPQAKGTAADEIERCDLLTELKNRGVQDIFIACVDGLKGFPEAIETVYPKAEVRHLKTTEDLFDS